MRILVLVVLALSMAGCGAVWMEDLPPRGRGVGTATVDVRLHAHASAGGSVEIVEQAPGQGFVVEGDAASFLAGFEVSGVGSGAPCVLASNGPSAPCASRETAALSPGAAAPGASAVASGAGVTGGTGGDVALGSRDANGAVVTGGTDSGVSIGSGGGAVTGSSAGVALGSGNASGVVVSSDERGDAAVSTTAASGSIGIEARAEVPRDGVWSLDGHATALTAIVGPGVQVDGVSVHLADLEALANLDLPPAPSAELATDPALEASAQLEHETLPRAGGETRVVVHVRSRSEVTPPRGRLRVHLVIDRSSSMQRSWPRVLAAARMLVGRLHADDELHIVAYGSDAVVAYPVSRVGNGAAAVHALDAISVGGGTNIEAGLELAYSAAAGGVGAQARSLVILLSDGVPNHGAFEPAELGTLVAGATQRGCTTSVIGLGTEFDARLLRAIAREGRGGYYVSAALDELAAGMVAELEAHARAAATDLSVRVALPSGVELIDAGGADVVPGGVVLRVPQLDAEDERRVVLRVRVSAGVRARDVAEVSLAYRSGLDGRTVAASKTLGVSFGPRAIVSRGSAGAGLIDVGLASALDVAGDAILNGEVDGAVRALEQHADFIEGRIELRQSPVLDARVRVVRRLARAVGALLPGSGYAQRRQVGHAFGELAMRFAR